MLDANFRIKQYRSLYHNRAIIYDIQKRYKIFKWSFWITIHTFKYTDRARKALKYYTGRIPQLIERDGGVFYYY